MPTMAINDVRAYTRCPRSIADPVTAELSHRSAAQDRKTQRQSEAKSQSDHSCLADDGSDFIMLHPFLVSLQCQHVVFGPGHAMNKTLHTHTRGSPLESTTDDGPVF